MLHTIAHMLFRALVRSVSTMKCITNRQLDDEGNAICLWVYADEFFGFSVSRSDLSMCFYGKFRFLQMFADVITGI